MLLVMYTHLHYTKETDKSIPELCVNHVRHAKCFSSHICTIHECFICKLLNLPYFAPKIINLVVFITIIGFVYKRIDQRYSVYYNVIRKPRAPPYIFVLGIHIKWIMCPLFY
jgi:hypothetical protein